MSHVTPITREEGWDLECLRKMCEMEGWEFCANQKHFQWYSTIPGQCEHAIRIPGAIYEIGIVTEGGEIQLKWDAWANGGLASVLGENAGLLNQSYDIAKTVYESEEQGHYCYAEELNAVDIQKIGGDGTGWKKQVVHVGGW